MTLNHANYDFKNVALSDRNGSCYFLLANRSNLSQICDNTHSSSGNVIVVETMTLDSLISSLGLSKSDFLRMDVEGAEALISKGWKKTIRDFKPLLFLEIHKKIGLNAVADIPSFLMKEGYEDAFYIKRSLDNCLIGKQRDIQKTTLVELINRLKSRSMPLRDFHIITGDIAYLES